MKVNMPVIRIYARPARRTAHIPAFYRALTVLAVVLTVVTIAQAIQIKGLRDDAATMRQEIRELQTAADRGRQKDGEAKTVKRREEVNAMALFYTGRVFSLAKYKRYVTGSVPDWARVCNGQPVCVENGKNVYTRGLDGDYYPCAPEWQDTPHAAALKL